MGHSGYGNYGNDNKSVTARLGSRGAAAADMLFEDGPERREHPGMPKKEDRPKDFMDISELEDKGGGDADTEKKVFDHMLGDAGESEEKPGPDNGEDKDKGEKGKGEKKGEDKGKKKEEPKPEAAVADAAEAASDLAEALDEVADVFEDLK